MDSKAGWFKDFALLVFCAYAGRFAMPHGGGWQGVLATLACTLLVYAAVKMCIASARY